MKKYLVLLFCLFTIVLTALPPGAQADQAATEAAVKESLYEYRVGPGDVLKISVWQNPDLTSEVVILPDGTISFPLIGVIPAEGKTLDEIKAVLKDKLSGYVNNLILNVSVLNAGSQNIYLIGKVNQPGRFLVNARVNVLQALAIAGGLNPFAKKGKIKIFRKTGEKTVIYHFDYDRISEGEDLDKNITLERGDIIVVP